MRGDTVRKAECKTVYDKFCPVPFLPSPFGFHRFLFLAAESLALSSHYSGGWSEYVNVFGAIREPSAREISE